MNTIKSRAPFITFKRSLKVFTALTLGTLASTSYANGHESQVWDHLEFEGSKLFITLSSAVTREHLSLNKAAEELQSINGHTTKNTTGDYVSKLTLTTSVLGNDSHFVVWQNPDLEILQRTSLYSGIKDWYRLYRFLPEGAFSRKIKPKSGESDQPWQEWSRINEAVYPYVPPTTNRPLSESEAIFEALAQGKINKEGDTFELHLFDRDGIMKVMLEAVGTEKISINYQHQVGEEQQRHKQKVNALKIAVSGSLIEGDIGNSEFSFMGYKNGIILHYDPKTRLPLRLSGKADYVGHVEIDLIKAHFVDTLLQAPTMNNVSISHEETIHSHVEKDNVSKDSDKNSTDFDKNSTDNE